MRSIELGQTGITASVLGFGCAGLLGRAGRRDSLNALAAAWDRGITFYDTARSYGYGESEALLGEFFQMRRDKVILSTKFGILSSKPALWKRLALPAARTLLSLAPASRGMLRKRAATQFRANQFSVEVLEQSIHESLRKLRTSYIDLLFMHAAPASVLQQHDLLTALDKLVSSGKVRVAGISAEPDVIDLTLQRKPSPLKALQFPCNVFDLSSLKVIHDAGNSGFAAIANHPFGGVERVQQTREILSRVSAAPEAPADLRKKLATVDDTILADVVLNVILSCPGIHVVIPAMIRNTHLAANVEAITKSRLTLEEIHWLRTFLTGN
jgi:aryl-alcohol dehydrogenase-like predicted oxidoreductase